MSNKGTDQPAYLCCEIRAYIIHRPDSEIPEGAVNLEIPRVLKASVAEKVGLSLTRLDSFEGRFSHDVAYKLQGFHVKSWCNIYTRQQFP